jgi:hypothetical protein
MIGGARLKPEDRARCAHHPTGICGECVLRLFNRIVEAKAMPKVETKRPNILGPGKMRTFTGKMIDPFDPNPALICIEDIAHALSQINRFGGHTHRPYSVAEHSVLGTYFVSRGNELEFLLHDATEAYIGDLIRPLKTRPQFAFFNDVERHVWNVIAEKFSVSRKLPQEIHDIDARLCVTELRDLLHCQPRDFDPVQALPVLIAPQCFDAKKQFLDLFSKYER